MREARGVSARTRDTGDQTTRDRVSHHMKDDRDVPTSVPEHYSFATTRCSNHVGMESDKFSCQARQLRRVAVGPLCVDIYCFVLASQGRAVLLLKCLGYRHPWCCFHQKDNPAACGERSALCWGLSRLRTRTPKLLSADRAASFYHLVGASEQCRRHYDA